MNSAPAQQMEQGNLGRLTAKELSSSATPPGMGSNAKIEADHRYKEIIKKLKRTLDTERRNLRGVRERLSEEIRNRTELETFLRHCMEDVKKEIKEVQGKQARPPKNSKNSVWANINFLSSLVSCFTKLASSFFIFPLHSQVKAGCQPSRTSHLKTGSVC